LLHVLIHLLLLSVVDSDSSLELTHDLFVGNLA
jgi:hypothetical protein